MSTAPAEAAAAPAPKGGALKLILAVVIAAGAAGGGAVFYMNKKAAAKPATEQGEAAGDEHAADEHEETNADEHGEGHGDAKGAASSDFALLAPQFVVNLNDEEAMRFLQVEVQVIAKKTAALDAVRINDPLVRNRLMLLFSSQTYHALLTREGKEKLQADAAAEINKVLDEQKKPHINGVVFTNLVMQ
ncbi:MAG: flagellar basal body-associated FliL family protein [Stagnimonas sp.]|nr:flagellar basal body-associated FliL family protein [Stagnimonas sp.]